MSVLLVRHTEVARRWRGRCYGRLDVGLSRDGKREAAALVRSLAAKGGERVVHSGARRTRAIAEPLARLLGVAAECDPRWLERDFGAWEGRSWDSIVRETGSAMDGMIDDPAGFRPGDGETTYELRDRVLEAWHDLDDRSENIIITHGGPIAALCGSLNRLPVMDWLSNVPRYGTAMAPPYGPSVGARIPE